MVAKVEKTQEIPVLLVKVVDATEKLNLAGIVLYHDKRDLALVADGVARISRNDRVIKDNVQLAHAFSLGWWL